MRRPIHARRRTLSAPPRVEGLEDRCVLSTLDLVPPVQLSVTSGGTPAPALSASTTSASATAQSLLSPPSAGSVQSPVTTPTLVSTAVDQLLVAVPASATQLASTTTSQVLATTPISSIPSAAVAASISLQAAPSANLPVVGPVNPTVALQTNVQVAINPPISSSGGQPVVAVQTSAVVTAGTALNAGLGGTVGIGGSNTLANVQLTTQVASQGTPVLDLTVGAQAGGSGVLVQAGGQLGSGGGGTGVGVDLGLPGGLGGPVVNVPTGPTGPTPRALAASPAVNSPVPVVTNLPAGFVLAPQVVNNPPVFVPAGSDVLPGPVLDHPEAALSQLLLTTPEILPPDALTVDGLALLGEQASEGATLDLTTSAWTPVEVPASIKVLDGDAEALLGPDADGSGLAGTAALSAASADVELQQLLDGLTELRQALQGMLTQLGPWPWIFLGLAVTAAAGELVRRRQEQLLVLVAAAGQFTPSWLPDSDSEW